MNWTPLHDNMYEAAGGDKKFYREGVFVNSATQGYLIDRKPPTGLQIHQHRTTERCNRQTVRYQRRR
ncbi:hypothetical protein ACLB1T_04135 [Escherichia coli]